MNVINALKPYIADKGLPKIEIFRAIIASTARAKGINEKDMFSVSVYCEELIREIISDVYVSNDKKQEYTDSLAEYKRDIEKKQAEIEENKEIQPMGIYGERLRRLMSLYAAVFTAVFGMMIALLSIGMMEMDVPQDFWHPFEDNPIVWVPILILSIMVTLMMCYWVMEKALKLKRIIQHERNK